MKKTGTFIAIEGIDGCGKTTLITFLKERLTQENIPTVFTKEPGGSALGRPLRELLNQQPVPIDPKAEFLLFAADRAQHMREVIMPGLGRGEMIITDRCADSSLAYQGYGLGLDKEMIRQINRWAMNDIQPDTVIYLRLSPEQSMERIKTHRAHKTTFELRPLSFWEKVLNGYDEIFKERDNVITIDAMLSPEQVLETAWQAIRKFL